MSVRARHWHTWLAVSSALAAACAAAAARSPQSAELRRVVDELIATDRAFAAAAGRGDAISTMVSMMDDDVTIPSAGGRFARGRREAAEALRIALGSERLRAEWTPIRGGLSGDGQHGFTFGYGTLHRPDTVSVPLKYLSYWVKRPAGWRVVAYRVVRRGPGSVSLSMMPLALPDRLTPPVADPALIARHYASLVSAERAFSDRAQTIGLGPAFVENGSPDAVNMGGRDDAAFVVGAHAIGKAVGGGATQGGSPVSWAADRAIVASSGDLGVTFGVIRPNTSPPDAKASGFPFFTVWRRARPSDPWRYVAE